MTDFDANDTQISPPTDKIIGFVITNEEGTILQMSAAKTFPIRVLDQDDRILYEDFIECWREGARIMTTPFELELEIQDNSIIGVSFQVLFPTMEEILEKGWDDIDEANGEWRTMKSWPALNLLPRDILRLSFPSLVATLS